MLVLRRIVGGGRGAAVKGGPKAAEGRRAIHWAWSGRWMGSGAGARVSERKEGNGRRVGGENVCIVMGACEALPLTLLSEGRETVALGGPTYVTTTFVRL